MGVMGDEGWAGRWTPRRRPGLPPPDAPPKVNQTAVRRLVRLVGPAKGWLSA